MMSNIAKFDLTEFQSQDNELLQWHFEGEQGPKFNVEWNEDK